MFYDLENPIGFAAEIHFEQSHVPSMLLTSYEMVCRGGAGA
jgi:hypothetical protein